MAGKAIEQTYNAPHDRVWDALMATITELGYKNVKEDHRAGTIEYRTGFSVWNYLGQQMTAVVRDKEGLSVISLTGYGAFPQVTSWGEKRRLAWKVLDGVEDYVVNSPGSSPPPKSQPERPGPAKSPRPFVIMAIAGAVTFIVMYLLMQLSYDPAAGGVPGLGFVALAVFLIWLASILATLVGIIGTVVRSVRQGKSG